MVGFTSTMRNYIQMAKIGFNSVNGEAKKLGPPSFKMADGRNEIRVFGEIVPRYVYWLKKGETPIPVECLAFDRASESFINTRSDPVKEQFPDLKCGWAYCIQGITADNKVAVFNLKKKLFKQIQDQISDIGTDPTDLDEGWPIVFTKAKNGPLAYNVEYTFNVMASSKLKGPVTAEQRALIEAAKPLSELMQVPTEAEVRQQLAQLASGGSSNEEIDEEVSEELAAT